MIGTLTFGCRATRVAAAITVRRGLRRLTLCALLLVAASPALAEKKYGPGVSDTEI
jgi:hypothetical protein